jgi:hypothetical protein
MTKILTKYGALALPVALMAPLAQAQPAGLQAAYAHQRRCSALV